MKKHNYITELVLFCLTAFASIAMILSLKDPLGGIIEVWVVIKMVYHNPENFMKIIHATSYVVQALLISYMTMILMALHMALGEWANEDSVTETRAKAREEKIYNDNLLKELNEHRMYFKNERKAKELEEWMRKQEKQKKYPQKTDRTKNPLFIFRDAPGKFSYDDDQGHC